MKQPITLLNFRQYRAFSNTWLKPEYIIFYRLRRNDDSRRRSLILKSNRYRYRKSLPQIPKPKELK